MERTQPFFSIIVPTYRRTQQLATCLASLAKLEYPGDRFEVIVVDDGGGGALDAVVAAVRDLLPVTLLRQPHVGPSGARNAGAVKAKGEYLVFTADDCMPAVNWLSTLAMRVAAEPDSAVGGAIINAFPDNHYSMATHLLIEYLYSYYNALPGAAQFFTPNNLVVPTDRYHAIGGFDESFVRATGEDREFCNRWTRHGYRMVYAPEVIVTHAHPLTFRAFVRQHFNYGRGTFRYRTMQASPRNGQMSLEPMSFYLNLLRASRSVARTKRKVQLTLLLGVSQVANAAGFVWESMERRG
ncbi:MAG: glycosyltransferase [Nitrospira sp.]|nr:glycosyltransferase [Nitrospira sp.]